MTSFHDRRPSVTPEQVKARLTSAPVRLKPVDSDVHDVYHGDKHVGTVFTYPPTGDPLVGRYAVQGAGDIGFNSRAKAARFAAAAHDLNQHSPQGPFTAAHHEFIQSSHPVVTSRSTQPPRDWVPSPREMQEAASMPEFQDHPAARNLSGATPEQARDLVLKHRAMFGRSGNV